MIHVVFKDVYLSKECRDKSRPKPDCLTPPNGVTGLNASTVLTETVPAFNYFETRRARDKLSVQTDAAKPYSLLFAICSASSSVSNVITDRTGPNISS